MLNYTFRKSFYKLLTGLFLVVSGTVLPGCSSTKSVPEGDALFGGYTVKVTGNEKYAKRTELATGLEGSVTPKPNASILGMRPKLWIYNAMGKSEKGVGGWIKKKLGEPPVLLSAVDTGRISGVMHNKLHNQGYFENKVTSKTEVKKKIATINWEAKVGAPWLIRKIEYARNDSLEINKTIRETQGGSLLKVGEPYNLQTMIAERERIDEIMKNKGYFYFNPDMLIFLADSTEEKRKVDVFLRVKRDSERKARIPYKIDDVYIFANYSLSDTLPAIDTIQTRGYYYIPNENYVRAKHLLRSVFIAKDSLYRRQNHLLTAKRLMGLGAYKYANIKYEPDTTAGNKLDAFIYLTPNLKKSFRAELQGVSKSNNFAGPGITVSFRNRNALKGSELLTVNVIGNYETQVGGSAGSGLTSYELGTTADLVFPRFVSPFEVTNLRSEFVPTTRISLGYNFLNRVEFFQLNSYNASYSYNWRPRRTITHEVTPINLQYVKLGNTTPAMDSILRENSFLRRSFEQQFILGSMYRLIYSDLFNKEKSFNLYNSISIEGSGNLANAVKTLMGAEKPTEANPRTVVNQAFSQYLRLENDFRYYYNFTKLSVLATRFIAGVGLPYGNSSTLPYIKQFTIGGPNSIRAFRARSLGPGTYNVPDENAASYFDQTGDIKLEANIEYRFPISGFFRGAMFLDAGNIWLIEEQEDKPGGEFKASRFMQELAIGTGFGLRVDIEFLVIRLDLGIPVRVPHPPAADQNRLKSFKPGLGDNGFVLNIAIGYPF